MHFSNGHSSQFKHFKSRSTEQILNRHFLQSSCMLTVLHIQANSRSSLSLGDLVAPCGVLSVLERELLVQNQLVLPEAAELVRLDVDRVVGLALRHSLHRNVRKGVSRDVVESEHRPGGGRRTLLDVTEDVKLSSASIIPPCATSGPTNPRSGHVRLAVEEQAGNVLGVSVEVDEDGLVRREEAVERVLGKGVRVLPALAEDEQVVDIDDTNADALVLKDGRRGDDFERDLDTTSDEDDVRVLAAVGGEARPYGSAGNAVSLGLFNAQPAVD